MIIDDRRMPAVAVNAPRRKDVRVKMTAGEFMMVGFEGVSLTPILRKYVLDWKVGGIILFGRNIQNTSQTAELCRTLQELRKQVSDFPLLIAVDQEGGAVARFRREVTLFPGNMALGVRGTEEDAYQQGKITGRELRKIGVNMNLAPVLDLYSLPGNPSLGIRSLGSAPKLVAGLGNNLIRGMQGEGIIATAKHFPGKGKAISDSHDRLPVIRCSRRELESEDLVPFREAISSGVKAIMASHAAYPAFDRKDLLPASLSRRILTGLLKGQLNFQNLLLTDDLGMGAIRRSYSPEEASLQALGAGADMILLCHFPPERERAFAAIKEGLSADIHLARRVKESFARICRVKSGLRPGDRETIPGSPAPDSLAYALARRAVTVTRDCRGLLPFKKGENLVLIWTRPERTVEVESQLDQKQGLGDYLTRAGLPTKTLRIPLSPSPGEIRACLQKVEGAKRLIITSYDGYCDRGQIDLINRLLGGHPDAVLAVLKDPRDGDIFRRAGTVIISFGFTPPSLQALAEVIAGNIKPRRGKGV